MAPVAVIVRSVGTTVGTTQTWKEDYFKVGSNWTDTVFLFKSTNNANQGSIYFPTNWDAWTCAGQSWSTSTTDTSLDISAQTRYWCAFQKNGTTNTGSFVIWLPENPIANAAQIMGKMRTPNVNSGNGIGLFRDSGTVQRANPGRYDFRWGATNGTDDSLLYEVQRAADIKNQTLNNITNYTGGLVQGWGWANGTKGADMLTCYPSSTGCTAQVARNSSNTTKMYVMGNFSTATTDLYAYTKVAAGTMYSGDLCWHIYNASGGWLMDTTSNLFGITGPK